MSKSIPVTQTSSQWSAFFAGVGTIAGVFQFDPQDNTWRTYITAGLCGFGGMFVGAVIGQGLDNLESRIPTRVTATTTRPTSG